MTTKITTHERPGVYSRYDLSGVVHSGGGKAVALIAKAANGDGTKASLWYTYAQAAEGPGGEMAALARLLFLGGAAAVYGVPVAQDSQYETAMATVEGLENVKVVVCDATDTATQKKLKQSVEAASAARKERIAVAGGAADATASQLIAQAAELNSERVVLAGPGAVDESGETLSGARCAAAVAGAIAGLSDPALPLGGVELPGLAGVSAQYSESEIDALVRGGVTVLESVGGAVSVVRGVTTRTKTGSAPDASWRELTTVLIVDDVIPGIRDALRAKFSRTKNTPQSRGAIRSQVIVELENRLNQEIITGYEDVSVTAVADQPEVCLVEFSFTVAHGLNQIWLSAHITV